MEHDPYRYHSHYCDPAMGSHKAVCGRGDPVQVHPWVSMVNCPDCISYVKDNVAELLERYEDSVTRLKEWE